MSTWISSGRGLMKSSRTRPSGSVLTVAGIELFVSSPARRKHDGICRTTEPAIPHQLIAHELVARGVRVRLEHAKPNRLALLHRGEPKDDDLGRRRVTFGDIELRFRDRVADERPRAPASRRCRGCAPTVWTPCCRRARRSDTCSCRGATRCSRGRDRTRGSRAAAGSRRSRGSGTRARRAGSAGTLDGFAVRAAARRARSRSGASAGVAFQNVTLMRPSASCSTCDG